MKVQFKIGSETKTVPCNPGHTPETITPMIAKLWRVDRAIVKVLKFIFQ